MAIVNKNVKTGIISLGKYFIVFVNFMPVYTLPIPHRWINEWTAVGHV